LQERKFSELAPGVAGTYTYAVIQKGEQKILMYYWYQQRQRRTASEFWMKYYLLVDNLFTGRTDGALVRIFTPIAATAGDLGEAEANTRLRAFANAVFLKLPTYLPQ
jgi:EpsI family protein